GMERFLRWWAVRARAVWDGEMKYGELDELSSRLAGYLVGLRRARSHCSSVLREVDVDGGGHAGSAWRRLRPWTQHPASRHEEIFRQTGARVVLASAQHSTLCSGGNRTVVVVSEAAMRLLGKSVASVSWVVDPNDHHKLAPWARWVSCSLRTDPGARLPERREDGGRVHRRPGLAAGGCDQHAGRRGRLYKTGDLVYYNADGNLVYVNRKDAQVKVRGQRVELGEIEHHVRECMPEATVAVFVEQKEEEVSDGDGSSARVFFPSQVDSQLSERLPGHGTRSLLFSRAASHDNVGHRPQAAARDWGYILSPAAGGCARAAGTKAAAVDRRRRQCSSWAQVLNIDADSIGLDDSFFRLGGDRSQPCRSFDRAVAPNLSLQPISSNKTISRLAHRMSRNHLFQSSISGSRALAALALTRAFPRAQQLDKPRTLRAAFKTLFDGIPCPSFVQPDGWRWQQHISDRGSASLRWTMCGASTARTLVAIRQSRDGLDVQNGPVLAAVLCDQVSANCCLSPFTTCDRSGFVACASRRVGGPASSRKLPAVPAVPFQAWQALQTEHATKHKCPSGVAQDEVSGSHVLLGHRT
ncbi:EntF Non-ribosomal peptide synthetase module protein, partial [Pyrenophora tritici-repentis]